MKAFQHHDRPRRGAPEKRRRRSGVVSALAVLMLGACKNEAPRERRWFACDCEYLTDFDYPGHVAVDVCSNDADPESAAVVCGQSTGVGVVNSCRCSANTTACDKNDSCRLTNSAGRR